MWTLIFKVVVPLNNWITESENQSQILLLFHDDDEQGFNKEFVLKLCIILKFMLLLEIQKYIWNNEVYDTMKKFCCFVVVVVVSESHAKF